MSHESLNAFIRELRRNPDLTQALRRNSGNPNALAIIAKGAGFDVSDVDVIRYDTAEALKLSDAELETFTGKHRLFFTDTETWCCTPTFLDCP
jgi:predicted ribosomally synthesized peptide with nif11-like leader